MRYYISDCHFFHTALLTKMDNRGFGNVEEMNEYMIQKWNEKVRKNDDVIIIGDFSWGNASQTTDILTRLNGKKYLIKGNHDLFLEDKKFDQSQFVWIKEYAELKDNRRKVVLSHYPIVCYNGQFRKDENGNPKTWMLYGHIHDTQDQCFLDRYQAMLEKERHINISSGQLEPVPFQMINCFCKRADYTPLTLDEWIELEKNREKQTV
jgi:calcineurin-like phosphoesterase family protein